MKRSISNIGKRRGPGRPKVGAVPVMVRLLPGQAQRLDLWRKSQPEKPGRPEAIRRLIEQGLAGTGLERTTNKGSAQKASELAAKAIEKLSDVTQPHEQKQKAKRRLIQGPEEFRDIRGDQPKLKS